jgi:iron uptake system component EfeO
MNPVRAAGATLAVAVLVAACSSSAGTTAGPTAATSSGPQAQGSTGPVASGESAADAVATYRAFLETNTDQLVTRTKAFTDAVIANKLTEARNLYPSAREPYEAIEPVAESFGDLDPAIDARENDVATGAQWTGFHRLEKALWQANSTAGMAPIAKKLMADVITLQGLVKTVELDPPTIANGAVGLLNEVSASKITGEEDRYSHTDLYDFEANVVGSQAAFNAVRPLLVPYSPTLASTIDQRFDDVLAALKPYQKGDGYVPYTTLTTSDTQNLSTLIDALADPLSQVSAIVVTAN